MVLISLGIYTLNKNNYGYTKNENFGTCEEFCVFNLITITTKKKVIFQTIHID